MWIGVEIQLGNPLISTRNPLGSIWIFHLKNPAGFPSWIFLTGRGLAKLLRKIVINNRVFMVGNNSKKIKDYVSAFKN